MASSSNSLFRSPVPTAPPPNPSSDPSGPSLLGQDSTASQSSTEKDADRQFTTILQRVSTDLDTLSRMRPSFSPFARQCKTALTTGAAKALVEGAGGAGQAERAPTPQ